MTIKQMQSTLYKFCSQFDEEHYPARDKDYLLYNDSDKSWCYMYFEKYSENYRFESPSYYVEVRYADGGEEIRVTIDGDAGELFKQLEENFELLANNIKNQVEENKLIF